MAKLTSTDLYEAIRTKFPAPEFVVMPEVRNATGFGMRERYADAIAMSTYPSRGLTVHGFEIKVSKSDWKRELANPDKAEEIAQYCDHWWIVAPNKIVDPNELPNGWGLLELKGNGLHTTVAAPALKPVALNRGFVASMCRSALTLVSAAKNQSAAETALTKAWTDGYDEGKTAGERMRGHKAEQADVLTKRVATFEEDTGIHINDWRPIDEVARMLKFAEIFARDDRALRTLHGALTELFRGEG